MAVPIPFEASSEKSIPNEINKIDSSIEILENRIEEIIKKLNPVMHSYDQPDVPVTATIRQVLIAQQLSTFTYKLNELITKTNHIIENLEI